MNSIALIQQREEAKHKRESGTGGWWERRPLLPHELKPLPKASLKCPPNAILL